MTEGDELTLLPSLWFWSGLCEASRHIQNTEAMGCPHCQRSPAGMYWEVLCVISILFIFFEVQLGQQLAGLGHTVIHGPILQDAFRSSDLPQKSSFTMQACSL